MEQDVTIEGLEQAIANIHGISEALTKKIIVETMKAGSQVFLRAAQMAAPVGPTGRTKMNVIMQKSRKTEYGTQTRYLVGVRKDPTFYAYFREVGYISAGSHRRERKSTKVMHSQSGKIGVRHIPGKPWLRPTFERVKGAAYDMAYKTLQKGIESELEKLNVGTAA